MKAIRGMQSRQGAAWLAMLAISRRVRFGLATTSGLASGRMAVRFRRW